MLTPNKIQNRTRHGVVLILALVGFISAVTIMVVSARRASAQAVAPSWSFTGSTNTARISYTATLLANGKVLVAGGYNLVGGHSVDFNSAEIYDPATGIWSYTGSLSTARSGHTATLLPNGKVLVTGGENLVGGRSLLSSAELYDPATGTWSPTGSLNTVLNGHSATLLPSGKVLVTGGFDGSTNSTNSAEIYDPATEMWSDTGNLNTARFGHTATLLPNGKVLVAGGDECFPPSGDICVTLNSAELYDPTSGTWSITGSLNTIHIGYSATLLPNGKVLVAGDRDDCSSGTCVGLHYAELYDPAQGTWSYTGNLNKTSPGSATLLLNGKVLVVGGNGVGVFGNSAELYDPATGTWSITANSNSRHVAYTATVLLNGKVLIAGGGGDAGTGDNTAELYDPGTMPEATPTPTPTPTATPTVTPTPTPTPTPVAGPSWTVTGNLNLGRDSQTATLLQNGKVLVAGGNGLNGTLKSAELYDPATGTWSNTGDLNTDRAFHTATLLSNGNVLVAGGFSCGPPLKSARSSMALSYMLQRLGHGVVLAISTPPGILTPRRCCPMGKFWSPEDS